MRQNDIAHLQNLHILMLDRNKIRVLPVKVGDLPLLTLLDLDDNGMKSLPWRIQKQGLTKIRQYLQEQKARGR